MIKKIMKIKKNSKMKNLKISRLSKKTSVNLKKIKIKTNQKKNSIIKIRLHFNENNIIDKITIINKININFHIYIIIFNKEKLFNNSRILIA